MTPTSQKLIAIYGDQLLDDLVAIESECFEGGRAFVAAEVDPACPDCERTHPWRDHASLEAGDKAEAPE